MKEDIKLYNRDGADLKLVNAWDNVWKLEVDKEHEYVIQYMRVIYKENVDYKDATDALDPKNYEAIDPSGGPMIGLGDIFEGYKLIEFMDCTTFIMEYEGDNN